MRKIIRVLFSRYAISAIVILLELFFIGMLSYRAYEYSVYALIVFAVIDFLVVITLINLNANPEYKVSWLVIVMLLPPFGAVLYALFYSRKLSGREAEKMKLIRENLTRDTSRGREIVDSLRATDPLAAGKLVSALSDDPLAMVFSCSASRYYSLGEDMLDDLIADILSAEKYIFLEYFIIDEGEVWESLHSALLKKSDEGVSVRILYDDIGCMRTLPADFSEKLSKEGIECRRFGRVTPRISNAHNNRDHRKIAVIDGRIAYTGGVNIADEYANKKIRFGHWKDGGVRIFGDAASGFLAQFLSGWDLSGNGITDFEPLKCKEEFTSDGGLYLTLGTGPAPIYKRSAAKRILLDIINQAKEYIYMTTPYLIIDYELTEALAAAARRGVDVRIITPGIPDKRLVKLMTKSSYPYLVGEGVAIYEYSPGFIHEKTVVSDDVYALVGTVNLDYRSLVHHFEDAVLIYRSPTAIDIKEDLLKTVSISLRCSDDKARLTLPERIVRNLIRLFAPLL